jgi:hypothetical protein
MFALPCHIAVRKISTTTAIIIGIRLEDFEASILNWLNSGSNMEPEEEKANNEERENCFKTYNSMERNQFRIEENCKGVTERHVTQGKRVDVSVPANPP